MTAERSGRCLVGRKYLFQQRCKAWHRTCNSTSVTHRMIRCARALRSATPEGSRLSASVWRHRHQTIRGILWLHALGIAAFALATGHGVAHSLLEGGVIATAALLATVRLGPRTVQASVATVGLIGASAILVHLSGGYIEFHFHFFVMVGLVALYQEWAPFLVAIGFVLLHHGVVGVLDPSAVYNHPAAIAHPWQWAAIHAGFIAAMSVVSLFTWRVNETTSALAQLLLTSAGEGIIGLDREGRVTLINEAALKLFDWDQPPPIGAPLPVLLARVDSHEAGLASASRELRALPQSGQATFRRRDGTAVPVEYVTSLITERRGVIGTVLVLKDVTDRQRLFQESERRRHAAEGLADVGRLISQSLEPHDVAQRIVESIRTLLAASMAVIYRLDPGTEALVALAAAGNLGANLRDLVLPARVGAAGRAVHERLGVVSSDVLSDPAIVVTPEFRALVEQAGFRATLAVPLLMQGRVIGALVAGDCAGRVFAAEDIQTAQAFADQAAIAIENARLHSETEERLVQSQTLLTVSDQVSGTLDVPEMMRRVARAAGRALGADMVGAFLADATQTSLHPIAGYHVPKHLVPTFMTSPIPLKGHPALEEAWAQGRAIASSDVAADPRADRDLLTRFPHRSNLFCPLLVQGKPIGGLFVTWLEQAHQFTPTELQLVEGISRQAAIALANARLVDELKTRQARLETLLQVGHELARLQPVEPLLSRIAEACGQLFAAHSVAFRLVDGDDLVLCGTWEPTEALQEPTRLKIGEGLTGVVGATGEPLVVQDPISDPRFLPRYREAYQRLGVRAYLGVPVKIEGRMVGVLTARSCQEQGFLAADVEMAMAFAAHAAVALENSRLFQQTQRAMEELAQTRDQLIQAQKMDAVGQLAGGVAHDFNNLLTVISGRSRLFLARTPAGDPGRRDVELIDKTADRAAALTRQLLAFSRKQRLEPKALDLNALVGGLAPMLTRLIGEHIELVFVPGNGLEHVMADPGQLEQVIMNLVVNARDAMPDGGMMKIETRRLDLQDPVQHAQGRIPPGRYMALVVQDTGCGMDATTLTKIFEPFFTTKEPGKGTGLGLSTVYGIIQQSGGVIGVDSTAGRGTTFTIYLPRVAVTATTPDALTMSPAPARGQETILLVEDEEEVRTLAAEILMACGYTVLDCSDPLDALVRAERHPGSIHLLLTDMVMPAMRGSTLAGELSARHPAMRVLYMSGYTNEMAGSSDPVNPAASFLQKPFAPETLAHAVRNALGPDPAPVPISLHLTPQVP